MAAVVAVTFCTVLAPASTLAEWSTSSIAARHVAADVAVDAHGDGVVAWTSLTPSAVRAVHLVARLGSGRMIGRTVWSWRNVEAIPASVVVGHGEVTVAWLTYTPRKDAMLWAAYGPLVGRWAPARVIGHWHDAERLAIRYPRLAVAPDGEVLLAWDESSRSIDGPAVAWRAPGHAFGPSRPLISSKKTPLTFRHELGPIPAFDARGRAYVSGICDGIVFSAPPHRHQFERPVTVAPPPAASFTLSLAGAGNGLAAWIRGSCARPGGARGTTGPVLASVRRNGGFGKPLTLTSADARAVGSHAVAAPAGGGTVTWTSFAASSANPIFSVEVDAAGALGPLQSGHELPGDLVPVAVDGGGDEILAAGYSQEERFALGDVVVRPVSGGSDETAPSPYGGALATATPIGRAAALAWTTKLRGGGALELSVWRP